MNCDPALHPFPSRTWLLMRTWQAKYCRLAGAAMTMSIAISLPTGTAGTGTPVALPTTTCPATLGLRFTTIVLLKLAED